MERFLYRFSQSKYAKSFILKGALMFTVWDVPQRRTTVDIDFLARFDNQIEKIEQVIKDVCAVKAPVGSVKDRKIVDNLLLQKGFDTNGKRNHRI